MKFKIEFLDNNGSENRWKIIIYPNDEKLKRRLSKKMEESLPNSTIITEEGIIFIAPVDVKMNNISNFIKRQQPILEEWLADNVDKYFLTINSLLELEIICETGPLKAYIRLNNFEKLEVTIGYTFEELISTPIVHDDENIKVSSNWFVNKVINQGNLTYENAIGDYIIIYKDDEIKYKEIHSTLELLLLKSVESGINIDSINYIFENGKEINITTINGYEKLRASGNPQE